MRRIAVMMVGTLLLMGAASPAVAQEAQASPTDTFESFEVYGQAQGGGGAFFAVGDEVNRMMGARVEVSKPAQVYAIAAAFQRGLATGYTYGAVLGKSAAGGAGIAPEPPPGEALALFPSSPREMTWEGPLTGGAGGPVMDGKSHALATGAPSGIAEIAFQDAASPGQMTIKQGAVSSRGEPTAAGVEAEALSVLQGINIGPLRIERMISRAYGLVPAEEAEAKGEGGVYVEGATVNDTPVRITSRGIEVGDQIQGREQKEQMSDQVREAMKGAGFEDVKLGDTEVQLGEDGASVTVVSGVLKVHYPSEQMKSSNPHGFSGGGFEVGGATIDLKAQRVAPKSEGPAVDDSFFDFQPASARPTPAAPSDVSGVVPAPPEVSGVVPAPPEVTGVAQAPAQVTPPGQPPAVASPVPDGLPPASLAAFRSSTVSDSRRIGSLPLLAGVGVALPWQAVRRRRRLHAPA